MNAAFIHVDAKSVEASIADLMAAYPELAEDDVLLLNTIQGATSLFEIAAKAVELKAEADTMAEALKLRISDLEARKARFNRQSEAMRKLIKGLMDAVGQTKLILPEATLSVTAPRTTVNVTDSDQLPQGYYRLERIADKKAIGAALMAGNEIPGAELALGEEGLTIRQK